MRQAEVEIKHTQREHERQMTRGINSNGTEICPAHLSVNLAAQIGTAAFFYLIKQLMRINNVRKFIGRAYLRRQIQRGGAFIHLYAHTCKHERVRTCICTCLFAKSAIRNTCDHNWMITWPNGMNELTSYANPNGFVCPQTQWTRTSKADDSSSESGAITHELLIRDHNELRTPPPPRQRGAAHFSAPHCTKTPG